MKMVVYDKVTGVSLGNVLTNKGTTIDEFLQFFGYEVQEDGQIAYNDGELIEAWRNNLESYS